MCNEAARRIALHQLREDWSQIRIPLRFPEGLPNMAPLDSFRITDPTVIIRAAPASDAADLLTRRWSWPGPSGRPVYSGRMTTFFHFERLQATFALTPLTEAVIEHGPKHPSLPCDVPDCPSIPRDIRAFTPGTGHLHRHGRSLSSTQAGPVSI